MNEGDAQPAVGWLDFLYAHTGLDVDADPLALGLELRDSVGIHGGQELRQGLEDRDRGAGAGIDVAELQRDDADADENDGVGQFAFAQHLVRRDHVPGARNRQRPRF